MNRYNKLYSQFNELLEYYLSHRTVLIYVALVAIKEELIRLFNKKEGEVGTQESTTPPPGSTVPPPPQ